MAHVSIKHNTHALDQQSRRAVTALDDSCSCTTKQATLGNKDSHNILRRLIMLFHTLEDHKATKDPNKHIMNSNMN
eukprot:3648903-Amphidinium_carterae.1